MKQDMGIPLTKEDYETIGGAYGGQLMQSMGGRTQQQIMDERAERQREIERGEYDYKEKTKAKYTTPKKPTKPQGFWADDPADPTNEKRWRWKWDDTAQDWSAEAIEGGSRKKKKETTENIDPLSNLGIKNKIKLEKEKKELPLTPEEQANLVAKFDKFKKTLGEEGALNAINAGLQSSKKSLKPTVSRGLIEWIRQEAIPEGMPGSLPSETPGATNLFKPDYEIAHTIPPGAMEMVNPQTGQEIYSSDGGNTWLDSKTGEPI